MRSLWTPVVVLACLLFCPSSLRAQATASVPGNPSVKDYADEAAVIERDEVIYRYAADGTGTKTESTVLRIQSGAALQTFAVLGCFYAGGTQSLDITYVRVRKPDGTVVQTPVSDAQDQTAPVTQAAPMYSDLRVKQLPVRALAVGDVLETQTKVIQRVAEVPGQFWNVENFGAGLVYLDRRVELHVPKSTVLTVYSPKFAPDIDETGSDRVYRWKGSQLRRSNATDEAGSAQDRTPPIAWTTFANWEAVGLWYQALIAGRDAPTPALQAKADELTAGAKSDTEKVRRLYEYVSQHNHYIGVEFGIGRFQPHPAAEVLNNQYGDCKDKHTLLAALLRAKGFQPSAVLIGFGIEMNSKVPSPASFNHLITVVPVDGSPVWLDATTEVAPYRVLLPQLRDKQALVVPATSGPGLPHLAKTPADLPFAAVDRYEGVFELEKDGAIKGTVTFSTRGDTEVLMRYASRQFARTQWNQWGQNYLENTGFNGNADHVVLDEAGDLTAPWAMHLQYKQEPWSQWKNYQIGSLLPNVVLPSINEKKPPSKNIDFGGRHTQTAKSTVMLPVGYGADLPDAIHLKAEFATFDETYRVVDGKLVSEFTLEVLKPKVEASDWKSVKKFADGIGVQPWIQLTGKAPAAGEKGPPASGENNPVAAELTRQTQEAIVAKDFVLARQKSDQAIAANPKQAYAWSQRGWLAWQRKDLNEAAAAYERELRQHPQEIEQYPDLIRIEHLLHNDGDERKYLLAYAKASPENPQAALLAGQALLWQGYVEDAVEVYRAGARASPENANLQVGLGIALLRAGKKDEALPVLTTLLSGTSDANVLNDGAYALVGTAASTALPLAEASAHKAVETLEVESAAVAIDAVNTNSFRRVNLLLATWDTLGWIYFAEGKDASAEEYIRAAWRNAAHPEVGLHLGQVLEKQGDNAGAMRLYELAQSRNKPNGSPTVDAELQTRIDALKKKGVAVQDVQPDHTLQMQRTFHVSRPPGVAGSGVFAIQVSADQQEKIAMMSGDEAVRGVAESLRRLDLGLAVPKSSHASLLRSGVLFCSTQATCDFVLMPPESAQVK